MISYKNAQILFLVLATYSYIIEKTFSIQVNLTVVFLVVLLSLIVVGKFKSKVLRIDTYDYFFIFLISLSIFQMFLLSNYFNTIMVVVNSFAFYFYSRTVLTKEEHVEIFIKILVVLIAFTIALILFNFYTGNISFRKVLGEVNVIALGEFLGIFLIVLFLKLRSKIAKIAVTILISWIMIILAGTRGAFIFVVLTPFIVVLLRSNPKKLQKYILISALLSLFIIYFFYLNTSVIDNIHELSRFNLNNILSDNSVQARFMLIEDSFSLMLSNGILIGTGLGHSNPHNILVEFITVYGLMGILIEGVFLFIFYRLVTFVNRSNLAYIVVCLLVFTFCYRLSSFSLQGDKTIFLLMGVLVNYKGWYYENSNC